MSCSGALSTGSGSNANRAGWATGTGCLAAGRFAAVELAYADQRFGKPARDDLEFIVMEKAL